MRRHSWQGVLLYEQKSWDTFAFLGRFPIHTGPTPPLTPQTMLDACIQNFFQVSTLYRVGEGRTATGNPEVTENCEYLSTVLRTFVHDCNDNTATLTQTCLCHSGPRTNC